MPTYNGFAFAHAFCRRNDILRNEDDYLILLALLWSPNEHLFSPIPDNSEVVPDVLSETVTPFQWFKILEPEEFKIFCETQRKYQDFLNDISASSQIFALRFQDICALILRQRKLLLEYHGWIEDYSTKQKSMSAEISRLINNESMEPPKRGCVIHLMKIALEYIDNLMTNPKNRSKYKSARQRMDRYINAAKKDELEDGENDVLDDIVGLIFERLIMIAFFYPPYKAIGPMYLCWMLEKRLLKLTDPPKEPTNWAFINNKKESLFANKIEWHEERPSTSDEARVYLFDELCVFWEDWADSSIGLSRFLFEKMLPFYLDFMKADILLPESCMTHYFVQYDTAVFSSDPLQRILSVFSDMLQLELDAFPLKLDVNPNLVNDVNNITTDEQYAEFLRKMYTQYFQESEDIIRTA